MELLKTKQFEPIQLKEMDKVKLMNRVDKKYWFHAGELPDLLSEINDDYYLLHIDGENLLEYNTVYYDTLASKMYEAHHNGKLNRYKVRRRSYVASGISFFEVKFKSNKGRTLKERIPTDFSESDFSNEEKAFLSKVTPFTSNELQPSLLNKFTRLTLVNKNFKERCTIDLDLRFQKDKNKVSLSDLVIVEVKSGGRDSISSIEKALLNKRIKMAGFSKYCIGCAMTNSDLKRNAFKAKVRSINKLLLS